MENKLFNPDEKLSQLRREQKEQEEQIEDKTDPDIQLFFMKKKNSPTGIIELENDYCKIILIDKNKWKTIY
jgi:predicted  nucleic acid-binding Zn-ribbon protein